MFGITWNSNEANLMKAVAGKDVAAAKALLADGADANHDEDGMTPLMIAAQGGDAAMVRALVAGGAGLNRRVAGGATVLHVPAYDGMLEMVKLLLELGAAPDMADETGITPIMAAAEGGRAEVVKVLLAAGAKDSGVAELLAAAKGSAAPSGTTLFLPTPNQAPAPGNEGWKTQESGQAFDLPSAVDEQGRKAAFVFSSEQALALWCGKAGLAPYFAELERKAVFQILLDGGFDYAVLDAGGPDPRPISREEMSA